MNTGTNNGGLYITEIAHADDCPKLCGGECNCTPIKTNVPASAWLNRKQRRAEAARERKEGKHKAEGRTGGKAL